MVEELAKQKTSTLVAHCLLGLLFNPEDGRNTFLRNVGELTDCLALYLSFVV
jgi:hypothetical protein